MKTVKEIWPDYKTFRIGVIDVININENNPIYVNDESFSYSQENLYNQFIRVFGNYTHNLNTDNEFINDFPYRYSQCLLTLYIQVKTFSTQNLSDISADFYKAIRNQSTNSTQDSEDVSDERNSLAPGSTTFNGILDDLQVSQLNRVKANNILKADTNAFSSTENLYKIFKLNEQSNFKSLIVTFLNSFTNFFSNITQNDNRETDLTDTTFLNGYAVRDVNYYGQINKRNIEIIVDEFDKLEVKVDNLGNPVNVYDPINNIFQMINKFKIGYWDGMTRNEIYSVVTAAGLIHQITFIYSLGFIVQFVDENNFIRWAESLIPNNIGNNPINSPDAWKILENVPVDINAILEQVKPYVDIAVDEAIENVPGLSIGKGLEITDGEVIQVDESIASKIDLGNFAFTPAEGNNFAVMDNPASVAQKSKGIEFLNFNAEDPEKPQIKMKQEMDCLDNPITNLPDAVEDKDAVPLGQAKQMIEDIPAPPAITFDIVRKVFTLTNEHLIIVPFEQVISVVDSEGFFLLTWIQGSANVISIQKWNRTSKDWEVITGGKIVVWLKIPIVKGGKNE